MHAVIPLTMPQPRKENDMNTSQEMQAALQRMNEERKRIEERIAATRRAALTVIEGGKND